MSEFDLGCGSRCSLLRRIHNRHRGRNAGLLVHKCRTMPPSLITRFGRFSIDIPKAEYFSDRAAAEIVTRHLPNNRSSVIDRIRKSFAKDREYYLRTGKMNEIINLVMAREGATRSADKNKENGDNKEPLVTLVLPDDDTLEAIFQKLRSEHSGRIYPSLERPPRGPYQ